MFNLYLINTLHFLVLDYWNNTTRDCLLYLKKKKIYGNALPSNNIQLLVKWCNLTYIFDRHNMITTFPFSPFIAEIE
jgi:hypothetical protein